MHSLVSCCFCYTKGNKKRPCKQTIHITETNILPPYVYPQNSPLEINLQPIFLGYVRVARTEDNPWKLYYTNTCTSLRTTPTLSKSPFAFYAYNSSPKQNTPSLFVFCGLTRKRRPREKVMAMFSSFRTSLVLVRDGLKAWKLWSLGVVFHLALAHFHLFLATSIFLVL